MNFKISPDKSLLSKTFRNFKYNQKSFLASEMPKFQNLGTSNIEDLKENGGLSKNTKYKRKSVIGLLASSLASWS